MADAPPGWFQTPDGEWHQENPQKGRPLFPDTSIWSRGKKLRVGLIVIGIAQIVANMGSFTYTISISSRFNYPSLATFGTVVMELSSGMIGVGLIWIALQYVRD